MLEIIAVDSGSIGAELDLEPGDYLVAMNGHPLRDLLDFQIYEAEEELLLEVRKADGELWDVELEKDAPDSLGLHFEHPEPTQCGNNCIFCFVHQLPPRLRPSLYVKDEDFRFSFLYGAYVTLTNLSEEDIRRIIEQRLSPLYVSVHATDEDLRRTLLGRIGPPIRDLLRRLVDAGIELHTQVVLCPGINDGAVLERTVKDLHGLAPGVRSLAVVPVGLTGYRKRLPQLRPVSVEEAVLLIEGIEVWQEQFLETGGSRFVYAADELYLRAGRSVPPLENYEDLAQIENGVGLVAQFREEAREALTEAAPLTTGPVAVVTGESCFPEIQQFVTDLSKRTGVTIHLHRIANHFFGGQVTVTGLITGQDLLRELRGRALGEAVLIPDVMLKEGGDLLLDDLTLIDLERDLGVPVRRIVSTPWGLLAALEDLAGD